MEELHAPMIEDLRAPLKRGAGCTEETYAPRPKELHMQLERGAGRIRRALRTRGQ